MKKKVALGCITVEQCSVIYTLMNYKCVINHIRKTITEQYGKGYSVIGPDCFKLDRVLTENLLTHINSIWMSLLCCLLQIAALYKDHFSVVCLSVCLSQNLSEMLIRNSWYNFIQTLQEWSVPSLVMHVVGSYNNSSLSHLHLCIFNLQKYIL